MFSNFNSSEGQFSNSYRDLHNQNLPHVDPNWNAVLTSSSYLDHSQNSNSNYGSAIAPSLLTRSYNSNFNNESAVYLNSDHGSGMAPSLLSRCQNLNFGNLPFEFLQNSGRMIPGNNISDNPGAEENYNAELPINTLTVENSYDHIPLELEHDQSNSIKKHRSWTTEEHNWFLFGLVTIRSGDWKRIARIVRSRTPTQVASHAQKYHIRQDETNNNSFSTKRKRRKSIHDTNVNDLCNERFPPLINLIDNVLSLKYQTPVSIQQWPPLQIHSVLEQLPQLLDQYSLQNLPELLRNQNFVDPNQNFDNPAGSFQYLLSGNQKFDDSFPQHQPRLELLERPTQHPGNNQAQHQPELLPTHSPNPINQVQHQPPLQELELPEIQSLTEDVRSAHFYLH